jgi:hypothetical protein
MNREIFQKALNDLKFIRNLFYPGMIKPEMVLTQSNTRNLNNPVIRSSVLFLFALTMVIFFTTVLNLSEIKHAYRITSEYFSIMNKTPGYAATTLIPWNRFLFFFIWVIATLLFSIIRMLFLSVGSTKVWNSELISLHFLSFIPVYIFAAINSLYENIFPFYPDKEAGLQTSHLNLFMLLLPISIFLEWRIVYRYLRRVHEMRKLTANLVAASPLILSVFLLGASLILYTVYVVA